MMISLNDTMKLILEIFISLINYYIEYKLKFKKFLDMFN